MLGQCEASSGLKLFLIMLVCRRRSRLASRLSTFFASLLVQIITLFSGYSNACPCVSYLLEIVFSPEFWLLWDVRIGRFAGFWAIMRILEYRGGFWSCYTHSLRALPSCKFLGTYEIRSILWCDTCFCIWPPALRKFSPSPLRWSIHYYLSFDPSLKNSYTHCNLEVRTSFVISRIDTTDTAPNSPRIPLLITSIPIAHV